MENPDISELLASVGLPVSEVVGAKGGKTIVRVYTEEKGWCYEKIGQAENYDGLDQQALANFAVKVSSGPMPSRKNLKAGQ